MCRCALIKSAQGSWRKINENNLPTHVDAIKANYKQSFLLGVPEITQIVVHLEYTDELFKSAPLFPFQIYLHRLLQILLVISLEA